MYQENHELLKMQPFMTMQPCKTTKKQRGFAILYFIHLHIQVVKKKRFHVQKWMNYLYCVSDLKSEKLDMILKPALKGWMDSQPSSET